MWNDVETTQDLLNFEVVAETAAKMIKLGDGQPISIGVSGSWGVGKSSLVQMIGKSLKDSNDNGQYAFITFNAWLYQGYDDARMALLQNVADNILRLAKEKETCVDKVKNFMRRINWLRTAKFVAPAVQGMIAGGGLGGPLGAFVGAVGGICTQSTTPTVEDLQTLKQSYDKFAPEFKQLVDAKEHVSVPKEIEALRAEFENILKELGVTLVVLVDDLDRCLPDTAISTLEAMRLLLFIPQTAFIIAADEQMIRNAVKSHFGNIDLSDDLVTSYFDKLIQIPLRVPRLSANEVKAYIMLLLADLAERNKKISPEEKKEGQRKIKNAVKNAWAGGLTKKTLQKAYGSAASKLANQIDSADQLANVMTTSKYISGNPRLIKRFLNNLIIRELIAEAQGMSVTFEDLVKLQLFERCAPLAAFDYLSKEVNNSGTGKPVFLKEIEQAVAAGEKPDLPEQWQDPFIIDWLKLSPPLSNTDLRPLLYLSRDKVVGLASFDELSPEGRKVLSTILETKKLAQAHVLLVKDVGPDEGEKILTRLAQQAKREQWKKDFIAKILLLPKAFPELSSTATTILNGIPARQIPASIIPLLRDLDWAKPTLMGWAQDNETSNLVKNAINQIGSN